MEQLSAFCPLAHRFNVLSRKFAAEASQRLSHLDIDRHFVALMVIGEQDGKLCQGQLGNVLEMDKVSLVRVVNYLVEAKYVQRLPHPCDKRYHLLGTTPRGKAACHDIASAFEKTEQKIFGAITEQEQAVFSSVLKRLMSNSGGQKSGLTEKYWETQKKENT